MQSLKQPRFIRYSLQTASNGLDVALLEKQLLLASKTASKQPRNDRKQPQSSQETANKKHPSIDKIRPYISFRE
jgi:hypothetical protein